MKDVHLEMETEVSLMQVTCKCDLNKEGQRNTWMSGQSISDKRSPGLDQVPQDLE